VPPDAGLTVERRAAVGRRHDRDGEEERSRAQKQEARDDEVEGALEDAGSGIAQSLAVGHE
jgi:hypothetical protein